MDYSMFSGRLYASCWCKHVSTYQRMHWAEKTWGCGDFLLNLTVCLKKHILLQCCIWWVWCVLYFHIKTNPQKISKILAMCSLGVSRVKFPDPTVLWFSIWYTWITGSTQTHLQQVCFILLIIYQDWPNRALGSLSRKFKWNLPCFVEQWSPVGVHEHSARGTWKCFRFIKIMKLNTNTIVFLE